MVPFVWGKCELCTYQLDAGADRRHSRPKEPIETMKGMASPRCQGMMTGACPTPCGEGEGVCRVMTTILLVVLEIPRRLQGGCCWSSLAVVYERQTPSQGQQFAGEVLWGNRVCWELVWEKCDYTFQQASSQHSAAKKPAAASQSSTEGRSKRQAQQRR